MNGPQCVDQSTSRSPAVRVFLTCKYVFPASIVDLSLLVTCQLRKISDNEATGTPERKRLKTSLLLAERAGPDEDGTKKRGQSP